MSEPSAEYLVWRDNGRRVSALEKKMSSNDYETNWLNNDSETNWSNIDEMYQLHCDLLAAGELDIGDNIVTKTGTRFIELLATNMVTATTLEEVNKVLSIIAGLSQRRTRTTLIQNLPALMVIINSLIAQQAKIEKKSEMQVFGTHFTKHVLILTLEKHGIDYGKYLTYRTHAVSV